MNDVTKMDFDMNHNDNTTAVIGNQMVLVVLVMEVVLNQL